MVFKKLIIIHGMVVSDAAIRVLIGSRFIDLWEEYKTFPDFKTFWTDDESCPREYLESELDLQICTWPCCSELNMKKFVIGEVVGVIYIRENDFNKVVTYPKVPEYLAQEITNKLRRFGLEEEITTVVIPDDN